MNVWLIAILALLPPFATAVIIGLHGRVEQRFVGVQLAVGIAIPMLALMTFAFDASALIDLALTLSALSLPGTLLVALFLERWL
jgi:multicomponent Na+:H+ antiporter subunit F